MINNFIKKIPFININNFSFSHLNHNLTKKKKNSLKIFFKREILNSTVGEVFFYGGARMGIYSLMKYLNIKKKDEVIVTAFTCSVVINAIKKFRCNIIYADIDPSTLGTCPKDVKKKITHNTKLIIAQHSFGIPCDIKKIMQMAKKKKIFVLEDCAISVCSSIKKRNIGTFGHGSIFSFDHTKPINCFVGGALYVKDRKIISFLRKQEANLESFSVDKIKKMAQRFKFENYFCNFSNYRKYIFFNKIFNLVNKYGISPYLDEDLDPYGKKNISYSYPSSMPNFALNCLKKSIMNFKGQQLKNSIKLNKFLLFFKINKIDGVDHYKNDKQKTINPFRFVWLDTKDKINYNRLSTFINTEEIWFKQPIINLTKDISLYDYKKDCINSEYCCSKIINLPNSIPTKQVNITLQKIYEQN